MTQVNLFINDIKKSLIESEITKEGDRAIDEAIIKVPPSVDVNVNDKIIIIQDMIPLDNISAIYNFNEHVNDESGYLNDSTVSAGLSYIDGQWGGKALSFNGTSTYFEVDDNTKLNFDGKFEIFIWAKWNSTTKEYLLSKRTTSSNGIAISVNHTTAGDVAVEVGGTTLISSSSGFNDGGNHLIRINRDSANLVTMYIDKISNGTSTISGDLTTTGKLRVGRNESSTYFTGSMDSVRLYKGTPSTTTFGEKVYNNRNPRTIIKFGGRATKISKETVFKKAQCFSFGKELAEVEIRGDIYDNKTPEFIIEDLIEDHTSLTFVNRGGATGITLTKYIANGKLIDILRDFAALTGYIFYTNGLKQFIFEPNRFTELNFTFENGVNSRILTSKYDDTEIVNDLIVLGENLRYRAIENFNGNGSTTNFSLNDGAISTRVTISGVEQIPELDYDVDSLGKTVSFIVAPSSGTNNVSIDYEFEKPLYIRGTRSSSIATYGTHAKRMLLPWIKNRNDGVRFIQSYLSKFKDVRLNVKIDVPTLFNSIQENDIIHIKNTIKNIDSDFVVKGIKWKYPSYITTIDAGEYSFDFLEIDKQITEKLHNLEDAFTTNKEVREYESPEEILVLVDTFVQNVVDTYTETLNIGDVTNIYDKTIATYGVGSYGSRTSGNVYGST
jgi:hypothetical protein